MKTNRTKDAAERSGWRRTMMDAHADLLVVMVRDEWATMQDAAFATTELDGDTPVAVAALPPTLLANSRVVMRGECPANVVEATVAAVPILAELQQPMEHAKPAVPIVEALATPPPLQVTAFEGNWTREPPPAVPIPKLRSNDRWVGQVSDVGGARRGLLKFGGASHVGPPAIANEKDNEDHVLSGVLMTSMGEWAVVAVSDGVGQSVWPERAAAAAGFAFVEALSLAIADGVIPKNARGMNPPAKPAAWHARFARRFCACIQKRLAADVELLRERDAPYLPCRHLPEGLIVERYKPKLYDKLFFSSENALTEVKNRWLQSTLLAAAVGPYGGFALLLGDGYARVDRCFEEENGEDRWERKPIPLGQDDRAPEARVSLWLSPDAVAQQMRKMPFKGAIEMGVLFATDGVSKSSAEAIASALKLGGVEGSSLADAVFAGTGSIEGFLGALAADEHLPVDLDNMTLAYARRRARSY